MRSSLRSSSLSQCSAECHRQSYCNTFSFGDSLYSDTNCLLSDKQSDDVSVTVDLVSDLHFDVFSVKNLGSRQCLESGSSGGGEAGGECYRVERTGVVFYSNVVRDVRTASDLQDCSTLCHTAPYCRTFTFKSNYYLSTSNCYLSELAVAEVNNNDLLQDSEWTLYQSKEGQYCGGGGDNGEDGGDR